MNRNILRFEIENKSDIVYFLNEKRKQMKFIYISILFISLSSCSQGKMNTLGLIDNKFAELDSKPHGVSTMTSYENKKMEPILYTKSYEMAIKAIHSAIISFGNNKIIKDSTNYLHIEFYSLLGFTDDVEFFIDKINKEIHFKSQSRVGYSDFGTNRSRMKKLTQLIKDKI